MEAGRQGMHAARCMLGAKDPYREVPFFWTKQYGTSYRYIGHAPEFDRVAIRGDVFGKSFLAGFYLKETLKAAATVGRNRELIRLGQLIGEGRSVEADRLEDPGVDLLRL